MNTFLKRRENNRRACLGCGAITPLATETKCLPCCIRSATKCNPLGISGLMTPKPDFGLGKVLSMARQQSFIPNSILSSELKYSIIKSSELIQQDANALGFNRKDSLHACEQNYAKRVNNGQFATTHAFIHKLHTELYTKNGHLCPYCSQPLQAGQISMDTIIPSPFNPTGKCKKHFYAMNSLLNNVRLACFACNANKGRAEMKAKMFLLWLTTRSYLVTEAKPTNQVFWQVPCFEDLHKNAPLEKISLRQPLEQMELIKSFLAHLALRPRFACTHNVKILGIHYSHATRHLEIACRECKPELPILFVERSDFQVRSLTNLRRNLNKRRTQENYAT